MKNRSGIIAFGCLLIAQGWFAGQVPSLAVEHRVWTDSTGRNQLQGTLSDLDQASGTVILTMPDGKRKLIEYGRLSGADQNFVLVQFAAIPSVDQGRQASPSDVVPTDVPRASFASVLTVLYSDPQYQPITSAQFRQSKNRLLESMASLGKELATWGDQEAGWKRYLQWDALNASVNDENFNDLKLLKLVGRLLRADYVGLELPVFLEFRRAIDQHLRILQFAKEPVDSHAYSKRIFELENLLKSAQQNPKPQDMADIGLHLGWLEERGQLSDDVGTIRRAFSFPNAYLRVSKEVFATSASRSINEASDVRDIILGTSVVGRAFTSGDVSLQPVADHRRAVFEMHVNASTSSDTVGYNDAVRIYSNGQTNVRAVKRFTIDAEGVHTVAANTTADTSTQTRNITTDLPPIMNMFARRIAEREVERNQAVANAIAAGRARDQVNARLDREANRMVQRSNEYYRERIRDPLTRSDHFPRDVGFATSSDALFVKAWQDDLFHLGAPGLPPDTINQSDFGVCLYETAINSWLSKSFAGVTMCQSEFRKKVFDWLRRADLEATSDGDEFDITFEEIQPFTIRADHGALEFTIRGRSFYARNQVLPAMNISLRYDLQQRDGAWYLVLHDVPNIQPPQNDGHGEERMSLKELTLRRLLINHLDRDLHKEISIEPLRFDRPGLGLVELNCTRLVAENGWFSAVLELPRKAPDAR